MAGTASADDRFRQAIQAGDVEQLVALSDSTWEINETTASGKTALMVLARKGRCDQVGQFLSKGADPHVSNRNGGTALMFAATSGDVRCVRPILNAGVDVNARGANGWSAFMIAAAKGNEAVARELIRAGADVNARDVFLWTPLHRSAYENRTGVVYLLLETPGIDIHAKDDRGATALHHAAAKGNAVMVDDLLSRGARTDITDAAGRTPMDYAAQRGHAALAKRLADHDKTN